MEQNEPLVDPSQNNTEDTKYLSQNCKCRTNATAKPRNGKGTLIASIVFLVFGAAVLAIYIATSVSFFHTLFDQSNTDNAGAAIGAVFSLLLSTPLMLISAPPTILFLSLSTGLLRKTRRHNKSAGATVALVLSSALLALAVLLTIAVIIVFIAK